MVFIPGVDSVRATGRPLRLAHCYSAVTVHALLQLCIPRALDGSGRTSRLHRPRSRSFTLATTVPPLQCSRGYVHHHTDTAKPVPIPPRLHPAVQRTPACTPNTVSLASAALRARCSCSTCQRLHQSTDKSTAMKGTPFVRIVIHCTVTLRPHCTPITYLEQQKYIARVRTPQHTVHKHHRHSNSSLWHWH